MALQSVLPGMMFKHCPDVIKVFLLGATENDKVAEKSSNPQITRSISLWKVAGAPLRPNGITL